MVQQPIQLLLRHIRTLAAENPASQLTDGQLLRSYVTKHDEVAFAVLVQRHGPMVLSVCQAVLHDRQDAEDAFQAAFLVLARQADSIRKPESMRSWLYGVAYRVALRARTDAARRRVHEKRVEELAQPSP